MPRPELTSGIDVDPFVELALVRHSVEPAALNVSEAGLVQRAWLLFTDSVPQTLPQAVSPSILWPKGKMRSSVSRTKVQK